MKTAVIEQFKQRIKNPRLEDFLKSDADYKSAFEKVKEYTDDFEDFEMSDNSPMVELMAEFNKGATAYYETTPKKSESFSIPKSPTPPKFKKGDRVKNNDGKKGTIYDVFERTSSVTYSVNWDGSRIGQAGIAESSLKKLAKVTKEDVKKVTKAGATVRKAKASRKATAKPRVKVKPDFYEEFNGKGNVLPDGFKVENVEKINGSKVFNLVIKGEDFWYNLRPNTKKLKYYYPIRHARIEYKTENTKPKATAKPKTATPKNQTQNSKPKTVNSKPQPPSPKPQAQNPKPKATAKPKAEQTPKVVTHIETPEHKQIKRFLSIRTKETKQLAMTAYKSLQKDITERKIRKTSPQADIIKAIQKSYYQYLVNETGSLLVPENILKDAKAFVGSQKPSEIVELVKRFIRFTGVSPTEKQIKEYLKDADKAIKAASDNAPYLDELQSIVNSLKTAKVGDTIIADNVGLSGLKANKIKIRK